MVEVLYYEKANKNKVIGYVDIKVPIISPTVLIFRKVNHLQSGERKWFNLPAFFRAKLDGSGSFPRFCEFETQAHNEELLGCLEAKVLEFCMKHKISDFSSPFVTYAQPPDEVPF